MDGGAARHDGGEETFNRGDASDCSFRDVDVDGLLINGASVVMVRGAMSVMAPAWRAVRIATVVVVVDALPVVVVTAGLVTGGRRVIILLFQDTGKRVLVEVVVETGADGRGVVTVFGKLLSNVGGVKPGLVVFGIGGVVAFGVVTDGREGFVFVVSSRGRGRRVL